MRSDALIENLEAEIRKRKYYVPMFTCKYIDRNDSMVYYCVAEKSVIILDFVILVGIFILLSIMIRNQALKKYSKLKLSIIILALLNATYVLYHYGIQRVKKRPKMFFILEIFRYSIMALICYYYCLSATGLLK